jgi:hypothetical protein
MYMSFMPAHDYDHPLAVDNIGGPNIRFIVGGNRTMTAVLTPEEALKAGEYIVTLARRMIAGPVVISVPIEGGPPPDYEVLMATPEEDEIC